MPMGTWENTMVLPSSGQASASWMEWVNLFSLAYMELHVFLKVAAVSDYAFAAGV